MDCGRRPEGAGQGAEAKAGWNEEERIWIWGQPLARFSPVPFSLSTTSVFE
jgi:hypothetical protein